jgi:ribosomal protein L11 methyltransferase
MPTHFQISVTVTSDQAEILSDIFSDLGADAVTMTDAKDEPLFQLSPEHGPLWQDTTVHALFDDTLSADNLIISIKENHAEFKLLDFYIEKIAAKNWVEETQKHFHAQEFSGLWICPQWEKSAWEKSHSKKEPVVFIEPGLAFGTGTHPTTQLCLTWLATHALKNQTVIDYGCGSGILALGACALDAKIVWATDHDNQALISTQNNANYNSFKNESHIVNTNDIQSARANIVIANILANPLISLAPTLTELVLPQGKLVLSGILANDSDRVAAAYENHFTRIKTEQKDEWVLIEFQLKT